MPFFTMPRPAARRGGFVGDIFRWLIMVAIYDIAITGLAELLGVSRLVAIFIFLGLLFLGGFAAYVMRQSASTRADEH